MRIQGYVKVAISLVIATAILGLLLAFISSNSRSNKTGDVTTQPIAAAVTASPPTPTPIIVTAVPTSPALTKGTAIVTQTTATVTVDTGQVIPLSFGPSLGVKAIQPSLPPLHTSDIALQALRAHLNIVDIWNLKDSTLNGQPITVTTTFGLVTEGYRGPDGGWGGMLNIPLRDCTVTAICTDSGKVLDHVENRPIWLIDIEGIRQPSGGPNAKPTNHVVYGIDDLNLDMFAFGKY